MPSVEGLDFETFGEVNLPKRGLANYVNGAGFHSWNAAASHVGLITLIIWLKPGYTVIRKLCKYDSIYIKKRLFLR